MRCRYRGHGPAEASVTCGRSPFIRKRALTTISAIDPARPVHTGTPKAESSA